MKFVIIFPLVSIMICIVTSYQNCPSGAILMSCHYGYFDNEARKIFSDYIETLLVL